MCEPVGDELEALALEVIDAQAALRFVRQQPGPLEHLQMPGSGLPGMREHRRDLPGGHRSAVEVDREEDSPSRRMRQRREHQLVGIQPRLRFPLRHARLYSATRLNVCQEYSATRRNIS